MALREPFPGFPPPLTTRPEGLLSMLGLQTNGSYPQHLKYDELQPSLDLLNWYLESRAEIQGVNPHPLGGLGAGQFSAIWTVPQQEVWVLLAATLAPTVPWPVSTAELQLCRTRSNDSLSVLALGAAETVTATRLPLIRSDQATRYLVVRPSVQIGVRIVQSTLANSFVNATLRFVRCQI